VWLGGNKMSNDDDLAAVYLTGYRDAEEKLKCCGNCNHAVIEGMVGNESVWLDLWCKKDLIKPESTDPTVACEHWKARK